MARSSNWLRHQPFELAFAGSSPVRVTKLLNKMKYIIFFCFLLTGCSISSYKCIDGVKFYEYKNEYNINRLVPIYDNDTLKLKLCKKLS